MDKDIVRQEAFEEWYLHYFGTSEIDYRKPITWDLIQAHSAGWEARSKED